MKKFAAGILIVAMLFVCVFASAEQEGNFMYYAVRNKEESSEVLDALINDRFGSDSPEAIMCLLAQTALESFDTPYILINPIEEATKEQYHPENIPDGSIGIDQYKNMILLATSSIVIAITTNSTEEAIVYTAFIEDVCEKAGFSYFVY